MLGLRGEAVGGSGQQDGLRGKKGPDSKGNAGCMEEIASTVPAVPATLALVTHNVQKSLEARAAQPCSPPG